MTSKWFRLKKKALRLRKQGKSFRDIENLLGIPRSTLSGWFKNIVLDKKYQIKLHKNWVNALKKARKEAVKWHNNQKETRLKTAQEQALKVLSQINFKDKSIIELALSLLYLGEGFKMNGGTGMGNSDPLILRFFIKSLEECFNLNVNKIKCELHLRADQNPILTKQYWSKELNIPLENFTSISVDKRTIGSSTYPTYNGVCVLRCGNIAIQRRLLYLARNFCKEIANRAVSSVGRASA